MITQHMPQPKSISPKNIPKHDQKDLTSISPLRLLSLAKALQLFYQLPVFLFWDELVDKHCVTYLANPELNKVHCYCALQAGRNV